MQDWKGKKVLVLGLGDSGWSMAQWLARHGASVTVADTRDNPPHAARLAGELPDVRLARWTDDAFAQADLLAVSPGIDRREPLVAHALRRGVPAAGDIEIFAQGLRAHEGAAGRAPKIVAITGSNGKSTVTSMAGEAAVVAGRKTVVAGNIGLPVLDALREIEDTNIMPDVFVLELSSFQLESTKSLDADVATVLNVTADHLDRYDGFEDYAAAKARIFDGRGVQVVNRDDAVTMAMIRAGRKVSTFGLGEPRDADEWGITETGGEPALTHGGEVLMPARDFPVAGLHNAANALATLALANAIGLPTASTLDALKRFRGLPHRVERIGEVDGVVFYDDSKGTNVGATVAALTGMPMQVVLIAGGDGKEQDFSPLAPAVRAHARAVVLIGRDAGRIRTALADTGVRLIDAADMEEAVDSACRMARPGDAVLLSPACASLDMYKSYVHRAQAFAAAVSRLEAGGPARG